MSEKKYFSVKLQAVAPIIIEYRIFAENEDDAYKIAESQLINNSHSMMIRPPKIDFSRVKKNKIEIKDLLTGLIAWQKIF